jgi:hypothetical protein
VDKLERIDLCLRVLKNSSRVRLSAEELQVIRKLAFVYLYDELGLPVQEGQGGEPG